jgi:hypothetical protein
MAPVEAKPEAAERRRPRAASAFHRPSVLLSYSRSLHWPPLKHAFGRRHQNLEAGCVLKPGRELVGLKHHWHAVMNFRDQGVRLCEDHGARLQRLAGPLSERRAGGPSNYSWSREAWGLRRGAKSGRPLSGFRLVTPAGSKPPVSASRIRKDSRYRGEAVDMPHIRLIRTR